MVLIQLLLPASTPSRTTATDRELSKTRQELVSRFGGLTAYVRAPAHGAWTAPEGRVERDDMVMVEVVTAGFDREWWRTYVRALEIRFDQQEIHLRALPIEMLDDR